jgi:hypothetical protein
VPSRVWKNRNGSLAKVPIVVIAALSFYYASAYARWQAHSTPFYGVFVTEQQFRDELPQRSTASCRATIKMRGQRQSSRCGARTQAGHPCRQAAVTGRSRCRMHGGASMHLSRRCDTLCRGKFALHGVDPLIFLEALLIAAIAIAAFDNSARLASRTAAGRVTNV